MRTYQTLSLIGNIFGILITFVWAAMMGAIINITDDSDTFGNALVGLFFAFIFYIVLLVLTFTVKTKTKALGILLIVIGFIAMLITNFWGIVAFALLLPAGIVALRYKARELQQQEQKQKQQHQQEVNKKKKAEKKKKGRARIVARASLG